MLLTYILNVYNEYIKFKLSQSSHFEDVHFPVPKTGIKNVTIFDHACQMPSPKKNFNTCSANLFVHSTKKKSKVDKIQVDLALKNVKNSDPSLCYSEKHGGSVGLNLLSHYFELLTTARSSARSAP